jgi:hypothetical protein
LAASAALSLEGREGRKKKRKRLCLRPPQAVNFSLQGLKGAHAPVHSRRFLLFFFLPSLPSQT